MKFPMFRFSPFYVTGILKMAQGGSASQICTVNILVVKTYIRVRLFALMAWAIIKTGIVVDFVSLTILSKMGGYLRFWTLWWWVYYFYIISLYLSPSKHILIGILSFVIIRNRDCKFKKMSHVCGPGVINGVIKGPWENILAWKYPKSLRRSKHSKITCYQDARVWGPL